MKLLRTLLPFLFKKKPKKETPKLTPKPPAKDIGKEIYWKAHQYLGVKEYPGTKHNPVIQQFYNSVVGLVFSDETPWCAAFVGSVLNSLGYVSTKKLNARSYLEWGRPVSLEEARKGDIVVLWRNDPDSWQGHVGFFDHSAGGAIWVLGGNQEDQVSIKAYSSRRLLSVRRLV